MKWFIGLLLFLFDVTLSLSDSFVFHRGTTQKFQDFFKEEVRQLGTSVKGIGLIAEVNGLIHRVSQLNCGITKVTICDVAGEQATAFTPNISKEDYDGNGVPIFTKINERAGLFLNINASISASGSCHFINTPALKGFFDRSSCLCKAKKLCSLDVVDVYPEYTPHFITIAHELIHLKHFLETILHYCEKNSDYVIDITY